MNGTQLELFAGQRPGPSHPGAGPVDCGHCDGSGYCPLPACHRCEPRRQGRGLRRLRRHREAAMTGILRAPRRAALVAIAILVAAASVTSFAESYRGLYDWSREHGLSGPWAVLWPLQVDVFIAVGELALFVALADAWHRRSRAGAWAVTLAGLAVSVAGNVGHVTSHTLASRATAAVPPLAAASALAVGLGVLKRVVEHHHETARAGQAAPGLPALAHVAADAESAARAALAASIAAGNPLSQRQLMTRFKLTRTAERKVRQDVAAAIERPPNRISPRGGGSWHRNHPPPRVSPEGGTHRDTDANPRLQGG